MSSSGPCGRERQSARCSKRRVPGKLCNIGSSLSACRLRPQRYPVSPVVSITAFLTWQTHGFSSKLPRTVTPTFRNLHSALCPLRWQNEIRYCYTIQMLSSPTFLSPPPLSRYLPAHSGGIPLGTNFHSTKFPCSPIAFIVRRADVIRRLLTPCCSHADS